MKNTDNPTTCQDCDVEMSPVYENNGFTQPEGPEHWEIKCYQCPTCGKTDEEQICQK